LYHTDVKSYSFHFTVSYRTSVVVVEISAMRQQVELNRQKQQKSGSDQCVGNGVCCRQQLLLGNACTSVLFGASLSTVTSYLSDK